MLRYSQKYKGPLLLACPISLPSSPRRRPTQLASPCSNHAPPSPISSKSTPKCSETTSSKTPLPPRSSSSSPPPSPRAAEIQPINPSSSPPSQINREQGKGFTMRIEEEARGASGGGRQEGGRGNGGEAKAAWTPVEKMATAAAAVVGDRGTEGVDTDGEEGGSSGIRTRKKTASRGRGGRRSGVDVGEQSEGSGGGRRQGDRRLAEEETGREKEKSGEQRRRNKGKGDLRLRWLSAVSTEDNEGDEGRCWFSARW